MKTLIAALMVAVSLPALTRPEAPIRQSHAPLPGATKLAALCFFKSEQVSGMNKICYYDCLGSLTAITVSAIALCPLNINR